MRKTGKKHIHYDDTIFKNNCVFLKLTSVLKNYEHVAQMAAKEQWSHVHYAAELIAQEALLRNQRAIQRKITRARFPVVKSIDDFQWEWPKTINRMNVENIFRLSFIQNNENIIFLGGVGLGKTHLSIALGYQACIKGHTVLFASAIDIVNTLTAAQKTGMLKNEIKKYLKPKILIIDELGYLPIDKNGADLLFQVLSQRYEKAPTILTTNRPFKKWCEIFNNDATLTSAVLDRLLHHAQVVTIEGKSYRMKENVD